MKLWRIKLSVYFSSKPKKHTSFVGCAITVVMKELKLNRNKKPLLKERLDKTLIRKNRVSFFYTHSRVY